METYLRRHHTLMPASIISTGRPITLPQNSTVT